MRHISVIASILAVLSALISVSAAFAGNLVVNGGFENGLAGWEGGVIDHNRPHSAAACLRVVDDDPIGDIAAYHIGIIPIDQAKTYLFQVWVRCKNEGQQALVSIDQYDVNGNWISGENQDFTIEARAKWRRFDVTIRGFHRDAAGVAIFLRPVLWTESGNLTGTAWFDDVRFEEKKIIDEVRGKWIRREGAVRIWQSPVEQKVRQDDSLGSGADGATTVEIAAARGEVEPFQIVIQPGAGGALTRAAPSVLAGPGGSPIDSHSITIREVAYVNVTQPTDFASIAGWTPDPLPVLRVPLKLEKDRQQPLWIDVRVPRDAAPGDYRGTLTLDFSSSATVKIPLHVKVWDFEMPREHHLRTAYGLDLGLIDRYHNLKGNPGRRRDVLRLYLRDFAEHRISTYDPFGDDDFKVTFPNWNWIDCAIVNDPVDTQSGNRVLEVDDDLTDTAVGASAELPVNIRHGVDYVLSWRAKTDGAHDYLVSVNQYDGNDRWISGHNIDLQRSGNGTWQSVSAIVQASLITRSTSSIRLSLYARRWTGAGELTGRTWFDDVTLSEPGASTNLVVNGGFQVAADQAEIDVDFSKYDEAAEFALGELGADSFIIDLPYFASGALGNSYTPPFLGCKWGTAEYKAAYAQLLRILTDHMASRGWLDRAYTYWYDEPEPEKYATVVEGMDVIHSADSRLRRLLTEQYEPELLGSVDIWSPILDAFSATWARERQAAGEEVWWYVCTGPKAPYPNDFVDHPGIEHRIRYWMAWKYKVQGDLFWQTNYWTNDETFPPPRCQDPWSDPMSYYSIDGVSGTWGNGDGRLLYPPRAWKDGRERVEGPTPSLRWELLREGIEDYEYFWLLGDAADRLERMHRAPNIVRRARALSNIPRSIFISTTQYTSNPDLLAEHRSKVARTIEEAMRALR